MAQGALTDELKEQLKEQTKVKFKTRGGNVCEGRIMIDFLDRKMFVHEFEFEGDEVKDPGSVQGFQIEDFGFLTYFEILDNKE